MSLAGFRASNHPQQTAKRGAKDDVDDRGTDPEFFATVSERFGGFTLDVAAAPHNAKCEAFYTIKDDGLRMPWGSAIWQGRRCMMCTGSGRDVRYVLGELDQTGIREVVDYDVVDLPCRACNGHGREATDETRPAERVWCNPPYSDIRAWVRKAWSEWELPESAPELIVMLLPANRVEQKWWQEHVEPYRDRPGSPLRVEFLPGRMRFIRPDWTPGPKGDRPPFGCCLLIWGGGDR